MDDLDRAAAVTDFYLRQSLKTRRNEGPQAGGHCLYCGEETDSRWCDADCRDEWQKLQKRRA